jgi:hypothetical protein
MIMNKEEDYRNLAGNITAFTDNTYYYEDWLVIQQYVDDWLDEIDRLNNDIKTLLKENEAKEKVIKKQDYVINELEKYIKAEIPEEEFVNSEWYVNVLDKLKELKEEK